MLVDNKYTKSSIISALFWKLMERGGAQGIQLIVQILLARILAPSDFGIIAIVIVFITISRLFIESGFNVALIQKKEADDLDYSSVFYLSLFFAFLMYGLIYFSSPIIAKFYGDSQLIMVLRVLSITLFFGALNSVQNSFVVRHMMFKKLFISSLSAIIISGFIGIVAALLDLGVWALVLQQLANQFFATLILLFTIKWRPNLIFSISRLKSLFSFGWRVLVSKLINTLYLNMITLIIGKTYTPNILGYYNRGEQLPRIVVENIDGSLQTVLFPKFSSEQDNNTRLKAIVRRSIVTSSFMIFPMMIGMAAVAEPLIKVILTDKWLPSVPFLQIVCLSYAFTPIQSANLQAINALGRSDITLRLEIVKKVLGLFILIVSIPHGIYAMVIGIAITVVLASFINAYPNKRLLNYSYREQCSDIMPSLSISLIMGVFVYFLNFLKMDVGILLMLQLAVGVGVYTILSKIFKIESLNYLLDIFKQFINRKSK